jgi:hypothetical protein
MPNQYFDTANHKKFQCDFAFKTDQVPMLQTRDQAKICLRIFTVIKVNCVQATCECLNYIKATRYSARISTQFDWEIDWIHLGTELQE